MKRVKLILALLPALALMACSEDDDDIPPYKSNSPTEIHSMETVDTAIELTQASDSVEVLNL
jgi:hypothetical protein